MTGFQTGSPKEIRTMGDKSPRNNAKAKKQKKVKGQAVNAAKVAAVTEVKRSGDAR